MGTLLRISIGILERQRSNTERITNTHWTKRNKLRSHRLHGHTKSLKDCLSSHSFGSKSFFFSSSLFLPLDDSSVSDWNNNNNNQRNKRINKTMKKRNEKKRKRREVGEKMDCQKICTSV